MLHHDVWSGSVKSIYELEAVLRIIDQVVMELLVWINRVNRIEDELLSALCLLRDETISGAMQEVPTDLGRMHELTSAQ